MYNIDIWICGPRIVNVKRVDRISYFSVAIPPYGCKDLYAVEIWATACGIL